MSGVLGWLGSIKEGLSDVWRAISGIPDAIWTNFKKGLTAIENALIGLPMQILDGIKGIFIPDIEYIDNAFKAFTETLKMKFNFNTDFFEGVFDSGTPVQDVNGNYNIPGVGTFNFKFLDTKFFYDGVEYFRPFIRGFLVLLMGIYNVRQVLGFIRQDAGAVSGKTGNDDKNQFTIKGW